MLSDVAMPLGFQHINRHCVWRPRPSERPRTATLPVTSPERGAQVASAATSAGVSFASTALGSAQKSPSLMLSCP